ncbi:hypothetical protein [Arthrobacter sp. VKM Ac-2550]|uniref:hypothetical protein n=1 Tax=Crystallibacter permensis TaxID=1938888 RepID=UPI002227CD97|nr:hypothetical protein [Arthrobacter sp. VKM Ac-2550]MCW2131519.1 hypothetical protein [Arthrobacter sp. VKM Ac-2550]
MFAKKNSGNGAASVRSKGTLVKAATTAAGLAIAASAVPLALAGPAQANVVAQTAAVTQSQGHHGYKYGCEVEPMKPKVYYKKHKDHHGNYYKKAHYIDYKLKVHCEDGYWIDLHQKTWKKGHGGDQYMGGWKHKDKFDHEGYETYTVRYHAPDHYRHGEKVYHSVNYRTHKHGYDWSKWYGWEKSHYEYIYKY